MSKKKRKQGIEVEQLSSPKDPKKLQDVELKTGKLEEREEREEMVKSVDSGRFRALLAVISIAIYLNSLRCGFVYDDRRAILENRDVVGEGSLWQLFRDDFWGTPMSNRGSHKSYRPLVTLSYRLQARLWPLFGGSKGQSLNPFAFHLVNLILHLLVVDLVFEVAGCLCRGLLRSRDKKCNRERSETISRLASLLFACHPSHVEAVTSLVGRAELLGSLFALLSFRNMQVALMRAHSCAAGSQLPVSRLALAKSTAYAACACLSKENSASVILINIFLIGWSCLLEMSSSGCGKFRGRRVKTCLAAMLALVIAFGGLRIQLNISPWARPPAQAEGNNSAEGMELRKAILPTFSHLDNPLAQSGRQFCLRHRRELQSLIEQSSSLSSREGADGSGRAGATTSRPARSAADVDSQTQLDTSEQEKLCSDKSLLNSIERSMLATRLYIPAFVLMRLLVWPSQLSYDWPLEAISSPSNRAGLIESMLELRFLFALSLYITLLLFTLKWLSRKLHPIAHEFALKSQAKWLATFETIDRTSLWAEELVVSGRALSRESSEIPSELHLSAGRLQRDSEEDQASETSSIKSEGTIKSTDSGFGSAASAGSGGSPSPAPSERASEGGHQSRGRPQKRGGLRRGEPSGLEDLFGWSLIWLVVPYLPASNLLLNVGFLVAERTLYLPSFGFCLAAAILLHQLASKITSSSKASNTPASHSKSSGAPPRGISMIMKKFNPFWRSNTKLTANILLISPLLILGAWKTVSRNADWFNERILFNSNLLESPAKSMANLASLEGLLAASEEQTTAAPSAHSQNNNSKAPLSPNERAELLHRAALSRDPNSAELHYNLALAMQTRATSAGADSLEERIEYHYKLALKLRPNFPLAALNLGAFQYNRLGRLGEALASFRTCAREMSPLDSKTFERHVQTQIECLISEARVLFEWKSKLANGAEAGELCLRLTEATRLARVKSEQVGRLPPMKVDRDTSLEGGFKFADLNRQLALINWLEGECESGSRREELLASAVELGRRSWLAVDSDVYLSLADEMAKSDTSKAIELLAAIAGEKCGQQQVDALHHKLAKLHRERREWQKAIKHVELAIEMKPNKCDYLNLAAELSYQTGDFKQSESLYSRSLAALMAEADKISGGSDQTFRRRAASGHVNYGAILQVNGRKELARDHYRRALDWEPSNEIAQTNLAKLGSL